LESKPVPVELARWRVKSLVDQLFEPSRLNTLAEFAQSLIDSQFAHFSPPVSNDNGSGVHHGLRVTCPRCEGDGWLGYLDTSGYFRATCTLCDGMKTVSEIVRNQHDRQSAS